MTVYCSRGRLAVAVDCEVPPPPPASNLLPPPAGPPILEAAFNPEFDL